MNLFYWIIILLFPSILLGGLLFILGMIVMEITGSLVVGCVVAGLLTSAVLFGLFRLLSIKTRGYDLTKL